MNNNGGNLTNDGKIAALFRLLAISQFTLREKVRDSSK